MRFPVKNCSNKVIVSEYLEMLLSIFIIIIINFPA